MISTLLQLDTLNVVKLTLLVQIIDFKLGHEVILIVCKSPRLLRFNSVILSQESIVTVFNRLQPEKSNLSKNG